MYTVAARFIECPTKPMVDIAVDWTKGEMDHLWEESQFFGHKVRLTIRVFTDEYEAMDRPRIEAFFEKAGAELTLVPIRLPRENVRSERIQELEGLYDKIQENAAILEEEVPPGIQEKAERLEAGDGDKLLEEVKSL